MKCLGRGGISLVLLVSVGVMCAHSVSQQEAINDWNALESSVETLKQAMGEIVSEYVPNVRSSDNEAALAAFADYDRNLKPRLNAQLDGFVRKYGDTDIMDTRVREIIDMDQKRGECPTSPPSYLYSYLRRSMDNIEEARVEKSAALVREAEEVRDVMDSFFRQITGENFDKIKEFLQFAVRFDPNNDTAKDWLKNVDSERREALARVKKQIDEARWPGHYANFAGPGNPDMLARTAMQWMQEDEKAAGRKDRTFAVAVRGDWVSTKKNLLGQTVQWGLPIWAALYTDEEKAEGVCRVFAFTILTREGGPDVKKEPPWTYTWVGDNYLMRVKNIKGASASRGAPGAERGFLGTILWLMLTLGNILGGALAAAPLIKQRVTVLNPFYEKVVPFRAILGSSVLVISMIVFFKNLLFHFALFADLLPMLSGIVVGLVLGKELVIGKLKGTKAGVFTSTLEGYISAVEKVQVPLGIACLAIGVLHLFAGRWWLI